VSLPVPARLRRRSATVPAAAVLIPTVTGPAGMRPPGAIERLSARRRRERAERRTRFIGLAAMATGGAVVATEYGRVWRRGSAPVPTLTDPPSGEEVLGAAGEAAGQTVEVAVAGYRTGSTRENALLNLLGSFSLTFALARGTTYVIRHRGAFGPIRNVVVSKSHIHHFVPGILLAFASGGIAVVSRNQKLDPLLAVPFGAGVALTLDESALLLKLDDVYWTEDGIVSVQISLAAVAMLSALALVLRVLRRGEEVVLDGAAPPSASPPTPTPAAAGG
jgi:hypothetical protein